MKSGTYIVFIALMTLAVSGCNNSTSSVDTGKAVQPPVEAAGFTGTVMETMHTAGYTYVHVDTGKEKIWAAGPQCSVKVGDRVTIPKGMLKEDFASKTLNRTFDKLYFVDSITPPGSGQAVCTVPPEQAMEGASRTVAARPAGFDFTGIKKPDGGKTVAEIHAGKKTLTGQQVTLRGKVVKFNAEIMDKNWAHVQDGTGDAGTNDLTVTTGDIARVGDTVLVQGRVVADKDFGYGYKYDVLIDNATLRVE